MSGLFVQLPSLSTYHACTLVGAGWGEAQACTRLAFLRDKQIAATHSVKCVFSKAEVQVLGTDVMWVIVQQVFHKEKAVDWRDEE